MKASNIFDTNSLPLSVTPNFAIRCFSIASRGSFVATGKVTRKSIPLSLVVEPCTCERAVVHVDVLQAGRVVW